MKDIRVGDGSEDVAPHAERSRKLSLYHNVLVANGVKYGTYGSLHVPLRRKVGGCHLYTVWGHAHRLQKGIGKEVPVPIPQSCLAPCCILQLHAYGVGVVSEKDISDGMWGAREPKIGFAHKGPIHVHEASKKLRLCSLPLGRAILSGIQLPQLKAQERANTHVRYWRWGGQVQPL